MEMLYSGTCLNIPRITTKTRCKFQLNLQLCFTFFSLWALKLHELMFSQKGSDNRGEKTGSMVTSVVVYCCSHILNVKNLGI